MTQQTIFYQSHLTAQAKIVNFSGWEMPLHYGSQIQEHHYVRQDAGVFDVSHMGIVDIEGTDTKMYLQYVLANNVDRLHAHQALYTCMLNEHGGIIDDLIVYKLSDQLFRIVINAGTREKDMRWLNLQAKNFTVTLRERTDLTMLALQGPKAKEKLVKVLPHISQALETLKTFTFCVIGNYLIARTGYTGEDGFEIMTFPKEALLLWKNFLNAGVHPCGLGARDTLRLEAGLNLYGSDMDETMTPLESNLNWTIAWEPTTRYFIGRKALRSEER